MSIEGVTRGGALLSPVEAHGKKGKTDKKTKDQGKKIKEANTDQNWYQGKAVKWTALGGGAALVVVLGFFGALATSQRTGLYGKLPASLQGLAGKVAI